MRQTRVTGMFATGTVGRLSLVLTFLLSPAIGTSMQQQEVQTSTREKLMNLLKDTLAEPVAAETSIATTRSDRGPHAESPAARGRLPNRAAANNADAVPQGENSERNGARASQEIRSTDAVREPPAVQSGTGGRMSLIAGAATLAVIVFITISRSSTMKWFTDLKIRTKLLSAFLVIAALAGYLGLSGLRTMKWMADAQSDLYQNTLIPLVELGKAEADLKGMHEDILKLITAHSPAEMAEARKSIEENERGWQEGIETYAKSVLSEQDKTNLAAISKAWIDYRRVRDRVIELAAENKDAEALRLNQTEGEATGTAIEVAIDKLVALNMADAQKLNEALDSEASAAQTRSLVIVALAVTAAIGLGVFISRIISKPLKELVGQVEIIAAGDLTVEVSHTSKDELGQLAASFTTMVKNLRQTLGQVSEASSAVASASSEISSSTEQMAAGAQEQTTQASEVASAVEEMTKTIVENSRNASCTADTARKAKEAAEQGGQVVQETVVGMKRIADVVNRSAETVKTLGRSSDQIGEIIGVIDDIADQTNLLALNAAIEAARAGEQGRGFAVVADEVRKLAERTTKATKEIAGMIKTIQADTSGAVASMEEGTREVDNGIKLADKAGASLTEIVAMIQSLTDMVSQIAAASEEQSSASEQISKNVEAISSVTNESAVGTQQIARAAEDLNALTERMLAQVSTFRLTMEHRNEMGSGSRSAQARTSPATKPKANVAVRQNGKLVLHEEGA